MSETAKRIVKNSILRIGGYAIGALVHFAIVVLIARYLGAEGFGHFAFIFAFVGIFQLIVDMGVRNILIRDIAVDRAHFAEKLGVARVLLWVLSFVSMGLIILLANLLSFSDELRHSTYLAGLAVIISFSGLGYSAVLRAFEEMEWDILGFVLQRLINIALVWALMNTDLGLRGVFGTLFLANGFQYLYYWAVVRILHGRAALTFDLRAGFVLLRDSFPLGVAEVLRRLTWQLDKLLLAALSTPLAVALFAVGYKFLEVMNPFTANLTLPLYPVYARLAQASPTRLYTAYGQSLKFLYVLGTPIAVILFVLSDRIVVLFFGEAYREAGEVLRILAPAVILLLPTSVYGYVFTALGRQRVYTGCVAAALAINLLLDLLLIPFYSYIGAAVGTLVGEAILFLSGLMMLRQFGAGLTTVMLMWRPAVAGLVLGFLCWVVKELDFAAVLFGIGGGLATYALLLLLLQTFSRQEITLLMEAMRVRLGNVVQ